MSTVFKSIASFFASIIMFFCSVLDIPCYPLGQELDMSKFTSEPTFCDDFSGELDRSVWSGHYQYGTTTDSRKGSYWKQHLAYT